MTCWSRSSVCSGRGASSSSRSGGGSGHASGPSPVSDSSPSSSSARRTLTHARCFVPNSRTRSSWSSGQPEQQPRRLVAQRGALGLQLDPSGRHQVDEHDQVALDLQREQLAAPPHAGERAALERVQRRVERLERVDAGRERRLDRLPGQRRGQPAGRDLHLRQLGHGTNSRVPPRMHPWIQREADAIARRAERELEALVAISSPSGDVHGAEECAAICAALMPDAASVERIPCSSPAHAPDLLAHAARDRHPPDPPARPRRHRDRAPAPQAADARRRSAARLRHGRHEGRRGARARRPARARRAARRLRRGRAAARLRRGVADRPVRPRRPLRRLGRVPVLRGRGAHRRGRGGRRRAAQGGRDDQGPRARPGRALGLGARPRPQRAARARHRRAGRRRAPCARRPRPPDRGSDRAARRRRVQRRPRPRRADLRPAGRRRPGDHRGARRDPAPTSAA